MPIDSANPLFCLPLSETFRQNPRGPRDSDEDRPHHEAGGDDLIFDVTEVAAVTFNGGVMRGEELAQDVEGLTQPDMTFM